MARVKKSGEKYAAQKAWKARNPWHRLLEWARRRCKENPHYVKRGIKCTLTGEEMKILWRRAGADKMKRPSLDRKHATKGYTFENCRVVEFWLNVRAPHDPEAAALLNGEEELPDWVTREDCGLIMGMGV